jgi:4-amino-4-deoxy-L-arabinose transferase-like glycosyltransferase
VPIYDDPAEAYWLDSKDYDGLADRMLQGKAYTGIASNPVELFRTPVYPAFLALVYRLGGRDFGNVALAQLVLGGLSTLILFSMMRAFIPERAAVGLCCLYALDPSSTFWATNVMSETLFTFAVVLVLYALGRWWASGSGLWAAAAGGIAGIATLVRPIGEVLLPVWLAFMVWRWLGSSVRGARSVGLTRSRWGSGWICFTLAAALVLVPYMLYNERVWGSLTISSVDTFNLGRYHAAPLLVEAQGLNLEAALTSLRVTILPQAGDRARFLSVIRAYPWVYVKMFAKGDLIVLFWPEYHRWFGLLDINFTTRGALAELEAGRWLEALRSLVGYAEAEPLTGIALLLAVGYQTTLYGLAAHGLVRGFRQAPRSASAALWISLMAATALALLLTPGPVGEQRFRVPAQPSLILLAAHGWARSPAGQACASVDTDP